MAGLQIPVETKGAQRNLKDLEKGFDKVGDEAKQTAVQVAGFKKVMVGMKGGVSKLVSAFTGLKAAIIGAMGSLALGMLAKSFLKAKTTSEGFNTRLTILLGSVEQGAEMFKRMSNYASSVPFQFEEIMESATTLSGIMKGGVEEIDQWMPLIGDLAAATGLNIQDTTGQVVRMLSAGASAADMFRERGVLAMLGFKAGVKVSLEETRERLMTAWKDPTSKFAGATDALASTWDGMMSMMSDKWFEFRNLVMDAGVFDFIKTILKSTVELFAKLKETGELKKMAVEFAEVVIKGFNAIVIGAGWAIDAFNGLRMVWLGLKATWHLLALAIHSGIELLNRALSDLFANMRAKTKDLGGVLEMYGKWTYSPTWEKFGKLLQADDVSGAFEKQADSAGVLADEAERLLMATNAELVTLATQEQYRDKAKKWTEEMARLTKEMQAERDAIGAKKFVAPVLVAEAPTDEKALKQRITDEKEWAKIAIEVGKSRYTIESEALEANYERYKKVATDKNLVDQWYAGQREEILGRESDRSIKEFEEEIAGMEDGYTTLMSDIIALGDTIDNQFVDGFSNAFTEFITGSMSAKDAFTAFATSFAKDIVGMIIKQTMLNALQGVMGSAGGGMWGAMASGIGGMFGGTRASGGDAMKGRSYLVGEKGPEMFVPRESGKIEPNGSSGGSINIINVTDKSMVDEYMFSESGEKAVMNVLSTNADKVKRVIR